MEIDDILKKSFTSPSFEYKEEHWTAASSMIDSYYRVRLRNRIIAITMAFLVLITVGFLAYQLFLKNSEEGAKQKQNTISKPLAEADSKSHDSQLLEDQSELLILAESEEAITEEYGSTTNSKEILNQGESTANSNIPLSVKSNSDHVVEKDLINSQNHLYATANEGNNDFFEGMSGKDKEKQLDLLSQDTDGSISAKQGEHLTLSDKMFEHENSDINQVFNLIKDSDNLTSFNTLPLPFNVVYDSQELSEDLHAHGFADVESQKPNRAPWNKLRYFAGAEIMTFPGMRQDANRFVGAGLSAGINWFFHPNFFLDAGLGLSVRSGSFDPSIASTQYTQFFGPRFDSYVFRPKELLNASIPISLGYDFGRNQLLFGYRLNYLIGVYGSMEYASHMNVPNQTGNEYNYEPLKNGWLSKDGFRNFMGGFILSYRYEFSPRIFGGVRFHYLPNDWIAKDFGQTYDINSMQYVSPDAPVNGLREKNWILGFNLVYIL
jgi:F0F1-type ATP synthase membrane subunit b/b'